MIVALTILCCISTVAAVGLGVYVVSSASRERAALIRAIIAKSPSDLIRLTQASASPTNGVDRVSAIRDSVRATVGEGEYFDDRGNPVVPMGFAGS